ncbi:MAG: DUF4097 domain-containing protein [Coriobacteriales bacterium]|jgi:hypothetical protein|nr:DUF4097 domain-containing protein [Coriobacteriales bacterium]
MKTWLKVVWIAIGVALALGIALTTTGWALGARGGVSLDINGLHYGNLSNESMQISNTDSASFSEVVVRLGSADVEFVRSDNFGYKLNYAGRTPLVEVRNGKLIVEEELGWSIGIMNLDFWHGFMPSTKLQILLPKNCKLDVVDITVASGDTLIDIGDITIGRLSTNMASGDLRMNTVKLDDFTARAASGNIKLNNVIAKNANIDVISGELNGNSCEFTSLIVNVVSGSANINCDILHALEIQMISGDCMLTLLRPASNYDMTFSRISGDIRINGEKVNDRSFLSSTSTRSDSSTGRISIDTVSGSVNLNFGSEKATESATENK